MILWILLIQDVDISWWSSITTNDILVDMPRGATTNDCLRGSLAESNQLTDRFHCKIHKSSCRATSSALS